MKLRSLDEIESLVLSTRADVESEGDDDLALDENLIVGRLKGAWSFSFCPKRHAWITRVDIDPWHVEGYRVEGDEPCNGCEQMQIDINATAHAKEKETIDGVTWTLQGSDDDGSGCPEYISDLGWVRRPHWFNRSSDEEPWICGEYAENPFEGTFKTMRSAARYLKRKLAMEEPGHCNKCGHRCLRCSTAT